MNAIRKVIYSEYKQYFGDKITRESVRFIYDMYNEMCWDNTLRKVEVKIYERLPNKLVAQCIYQDNKFTIAISKSLLLDTSNESSAVGIMCRDRIRCLMNVIEHETIHIYLIQYGYDNGGRISHSELFKSIAKTKFKHRRVGHNL